MLRLQKESKDSLMTQTKFKGVLFSIDFLGPQIPVIWHGEKTMGNWMIGYPVIDGIQCNLVKVRFHKTSIIQIRPCGPSLPVV